MLLVIRLSYFQLFLVILNWSELALGRPNQTECLLVVIV